VASQTGLALENARLTDAMAKEMAQREKMGRELEIAREVQERLFPQEIVAVPGLDYCGACRPALGVGGDYYDFILLPGGKLGIAVGDVSGKGISAALMMASLQASLRGQAMVAPEDLATVVTNVSRLVFEASSSNRYATFFYAQYDPASRQLVYVNAGHNPPLVLRKCKAHATTATPPQAACDCRVEKLDQGGVVVGLLREAPYQQGTIHLQPGDLLVAYTDGVSESMDSDDEEWGEDRMLQCIQSCDSLCAADIIQRVLAAAETFAKGAPQHDDMTLVVARIV
jgi:sigma-B regulation protein RsbU (phosphoserine phosphatase)